MKAASVVQLRKELEHLDNEKLKQLCLRLARFKLENKELLTYLLFEVEDELGYVQSIKSQLDILFLDINTQHYFYIKKSVRKILSLTKKFIRYSKKKETEAELLLYFCKKLNEMKPSIQRSQRLLNVYNSQIKMIKKAIEKLHEDLQYDYQLELDNLLDNA